MKVAVCVNNRGAMGRLDVGVSYVYEERGEKGMVCVWDKMGEMRLWFRRRFRFEEED